MSKFSQIFTYFSESREKNGDITFIVSGKKIRAHRNIIAALSLAYRDQFYHTDRNKSEFEVNGVSEAAFKEFLQFFYCEEIKLTVENVCTVLDLAEKSIVPGLVKECLDYILHNVNIQNLCTVYQSAISHNIPLLKDSCEYKIAENTIELFGTDNFRQCDQETLGHILKLEKLNCEEIAIFDACIAWARAACDKNNIDGTKAKNLRNALGNAIYEIRFGSMALREFVDRYQEIEDFFNYREYKEITFMIAKKDFTPQLFNPAPRRFDEDRVKVEVHVCLFDCRNKATLEICLQLLFFFIETHAQFCLIC